MHRLNPTSSIDPSFVHIAPFIHFRKVKPLAAESDSESTMNLQDPDLILLFTWTGAQPYRIAKYTAGYTKLFPSSPIMVVTTSLNDLVRRSSTKKHRSLSPAVLTLLSSHLNSNFLLHCFSEDGAHKATQFAKAFRKSTGRRLPISALCLDSARGTLVHAKPAPAHWCQKPTNSTSALQTLTSLLAYTLSPSSWTTYPLTCDAFTSDSPNHLFAFDKFRRALNDPELWNPNASRCYLFSNTDKLTHPRSVVEHARSAKQLGARVFLTSFEDHAPCDRVEAGRYWATVQRTWDTRTSLSTSTSPSPSIPPPSYEAETEKPVYDIYATAKNPNLDIHVSVHELPSTYSHNHSPIEEQTLEYPLHSASSSIYSSFKQGPTTATTTTTPVLVAAAAAAARLSSSYTGPARICLKKQQRKWYDCLRPVPGYQGWGGMGVDTAEYSYQRLTAASAAAAAAEKRQKQTEKRERRERQRQGEHESSTATTSSFYQYFYAGVCV